jgi:hypothetical protein
MPRRSVIQQVFFGQSCALFLVIRDQFSVFSSQFSAFGSAPDAP